MDDTLIDVTAASIDGREIAVESGSVETIVDWDSDLPGANVHRVQIIPAEPFEIEPGEYDCSVSVGSDGWLTGKCDVSAAGAQILLRTRALWLRI